MILYVISVGLSVTMGLMGFINLAHGVFAMAGGYILSTVMARFGLPFPLALLIAFAAVSVGSIVLERLLYSRLYTAGELAQVLFSIGSSSAIWRRRSFFPTICAARCTSSAAISPPIGFFSSSSRR